MALGFEKPCNATSADFLTSITNPAERIVQAGNEDQAPRLPEEFANMWKHSVNYRVLQDEITATRLALGRHDQLHAEKLQ